MSKKNDPAIQPGEGARAVDNFREDYIPTEQTMQEDDRFVIDTDAKAAWAMGKIKEAREQRDRFVEWYKTKIKDIEEQTDFDTMRYEAMLAEYFATVPHKVTKTQESYSLPGGKLVVKKQAPEYKRDDAVVIGWLKASGNTQYIKTQEALDWASLKANVGVFNGTCVDENGEIIPGIEVVERDDKFVVEV